jgi:hypothetical protein
MLRNLKVIFIHGISDLATNYSQKLFLNVLSACRANLVLEGQSLEAIEGTLSKVVHHEVLWADLTTDLTNRYLQLAYQRPRFFWGHLTRPIDPLGIQIMQYIKDKGDKKSGPGPMNILRNVDGDIARILAMEDLGTSPAPGENEHTIFVTHSLGSVIGFDYVMGFRKPYSLRPHTTVHSFITMGSPLPLFTSAMGHADSDFILPPNVHRWVNIRSPRDALARPLQPFFHNIPIDDHEVRTRFLPLAAHSAYWQDGATARIIADEVLKTLA